MSTIKLFTNYFDNQLISLNKEKKYPILGFQPLKSDYFSILHCDRELNIFEL